MLLSLKAEPTAGSAVAPKITHVSSLQGRDTYNLNSARGPLLTNVAVPNARPTTYGVGIVGRGRTTGDFVLEVSLPGDANGDGVVDRTDIGRVRASYGSVAGGRRYDPGADSNADGSIGVVDFGLARRNLGARASVVAIDVRPSSIAPSTLTPFPTSCPRPWRRPRQWSRSPYSRTCDRSEPSPCSRFAPLAIHARPPCADFEFGDISRTHRARSDLGFSRSRGGRRGPARGRGGSWLGLANWPNQRHCMQHII